MKVERSICAHQERMCGREGWSLMKVRMDGRKPTSGGGGTCADLEGLRGDEGNSS